MGKKFLQNWELSFTNYAHSLLPAIVFFLDSVRLIFYFYPDLRRKLVCDPLVRIQLWYTWIWEAYNYLGSIIYVQSLLPCDIEPDLPTGLAWDCSIFIWDPICNNIIAKRLQLQLLSQLSVAILSHLFVSFLGSAWILIPLQFI